MRTNYRMGVPPVARGVQADLQQAVVRRINQLCKQKDWTYYRLAMESELSPRTINYVATGQNQSINLNTIKKIADACGISITEFFDTAYFRNLPME